MTETEQQYVFGEIEEIHDEIEINYRKFDNFDILGSYPYSHNFIHKRRGIPDNIGAEWESIRVELASNRRPKNQSLAGSIFVRVYDQRVDLLSVMIVGREGDPYHQGLFFFDVLLPASNVSSLMFTQSTTEISYNSFGFNINSSLRKDGTVSIDKKRKFGDTLELLYALKDLVVNDKSNIVHSWMGDVKLNRKNLMQTCETMLKMLHSPPRPFKDFVLGYFRNRSHDILLNFKNCVDLDDDVMTTLFFKMVRAFEANGSYCRHLYNQKQYDLALKQEENMLEKVCEKQGSSWLDLL